MAGLSSTGTTTGGPRTSGREPCNAASSSEVLVGIGSPRTVGTSTSRRFAERGVSAILHRHSRQPLPMCGDTTALLTPLHQGASRHRTSRPTAALSADNTQSAHRSRTVPPPPASKSDASRCHQQRSAPATGKPSLRDGWTSKITCAKHVTGRSDRRPRSPGVRGAGYDLSRTYQHHKQENGHYPHGAHDQTNWLRRLNAQHPDHGRQNPSKTKIDGPQ